MARYYAEGPTGRRRRVIYARTQREAERKLRDALHGLEHGRPPVPANLTVGRFLEAWSRDGCPGRRGTLAPTTLRRYQGIVRLQLIPHLGRIRLADLQPADVEGMLAALAAQGATAWTLTTVRSVLRSALSRGERNQLVLRNVAKLAGVVSPPRHHPTVLTPEAVALVLDGCGPGLRRLVTVAIDTGMRQGEQLGLRWQDVDFEGRRLFVRTTLQRVGYAYSLGPPKTATSERELALSDLTLRALADERAAQAAEREAAGRRWSDGIPDLVFTTELGVPRNGTALTKAFQKALSAAGLGRLRWHDLRAVHGGLLVQAGVGMATTRDRLGHSSIAVTSAFYAGVTDALQREAADKVGKLLAR